MRKSDALEEAEQVERRLQFEIVENVVLRELGDGEGHVADQRAERFRKRREGLPGERLEIVEGRGQAFRPVGSSWTTSAQR